MLTKIYKLIFDISLCYTIGAFLLRYLGSKSISVESFLILLLTALISILLERKKTIKHLAMLLIPGSYLLVVRPSMIELVVFLVIWAYYSYVTITERFVIGRDEFVYMLKRFSLLFLILIFFIFNNASKFIVSVEVAGPYLATCLVTAIFLLRHLRAANQMEQMKSYRRQQLIEIIIFVVTCLLLTLARAPQNLAMGIKLLYHYAISPIVTFVAFIAGSIVLGLLYLVYAVIGFLTNNKEIRKLEFELGGAADKKVVLAERMEGNVVEWLIPLLYSIGIIIGLVILFFVFRWLMGEKLKQNTSESILEKREFIEVGKDKKCKYEKRRPKESRAAVRYYYGKYLLWLQHKRIQLLHQDTTEEINDKYNRVLIEDVNEKEKASLELKRLYRKSRYQMSEEMTSEEVEKAKQLYQKIKNSKLSG